MTGRAYYNENDPRAAAWLRHLVAADIIAAGDVDERSVVDVSPSDIQGYAQCHFFAGIGGWSYALRLAGWPDNRPVWTGSCPCQPFSAAGKQKGEADERHLWPEFRRLIAERRPSTVFGEQVASRLGREWLAGVRADLEALGYAVGAADLCAAGVGAPHIRQRLYWMADAGRGIVRNERQPMARTACGSESTEDQRQRLRHDIGDGGAVIRMGDASFDGRREECQVAGRRGEGDSAQGRIERPWTYDRIDCLDGKSRRVEPGIFPLVDGLPRGVVPSGDPGSPDYANATAEARMMRLRGYGNAIVPQVAAEFVIAYLEARREL